MLVGQSETDNANRVLAQHTATRVHSIHYTAIAYDTDIIKQHLKQIT